MFPKPDRAAWRRRARALSNEIGRGASHRGDTANKLGRRPLRPGGLRAGAGEDFLQGGHALQGDYGHKVFLGRLPFLFLAKAIS